MTARRLAAIGIVGTLMALPAIAATAQDAPLGGIQVATFFGPNNCEGNVPSSKRPRRPRCTFRPVDATVLVIDTANGRTVARVRTGNDGRGGARLAPGEYELRSGQPHDVFATPPQVKRVTLVAGVFEDAILDFDPGIR